MNVLTQFYRDIELILGREIPLPDKLSAIRSLLTNHLIQAEFKLSLVSEVIHSIQNHTDNSPWLCPHLFYHERLKFSVRVIFWPSFYDNNPHEHKTWSVTGVLLNRLDIFTYHLLDDPKRLQLDKLFHAHNGQVGYLLPGCIHKVFNPSHQLSASLHIFNNIDIDNPEENAIWYPSARRFNLTAGLKERALGSLLAILATIHSEQSLRMAKKIFALADLNIKLQALAQIYRYDQGAAQNYFTAALQGADHAT